MRHEAIWLLRFLIVVAMFGGVFGSGVYVGVRRSTRRSPVGWDGVPAGVEVRAALSNRSDLFAPEVDLRSDADTRPGGPSGRPVDIRGELTAGS